MSTRYLLKRIVSAVGNCILNFCSALQRNPNFFLKSCFLSIYFSTGPYCFALIGIWGLCTIKFDISDSNVEFNLLLALIKIVIVESGFLKQSKKVVRGDGVFFY